MPIYYVNVDCCFVSIQYRPMKEDKKGHKNQEIILGLIHSKNTLSKLASSITIHTVHLLHKELTVIP